MAKKKKKAKTVIAPTRHKLPMDYIIAVADRIHSTNPTMQILENTLKEFYCTAYSNGYFARISDSKLFKEKQAISFKKEWDRVKTEIDDDIHESK